MWDIAGEEQKYKILGIPRKKYGMAEDRQGREEGYQTEKGQELR